MLQNPALRAALGERIERKILERTWRQVRQLHVEVTEDRVLVQGLVPSYYVKQLAIQVLMEVLDKGFYPPASVGLVVNAGECGALGESSHPSLSSQSICS